jgi:hypothetical protein
MLFLPGGFNEDAQFFEQFNGVTRRWKTDVLSLSGVFYAKAWHYWQQFKLEFSRDSQWPPKYLQKS